MAQDDLVDDGALVARLEALANALTEVSDLIALRGHLPGDEARAVALSAHRLVGETNAAAQPDDEINAKYRSRMRHECFPTLTGAWFYPYDPKAEDVRHKDIVAGLINECRFNGQVSRFYSVAEHSVKVATVVEHLATKEARDGNFSHDMIPLATLYALLHDAHEAYTGDIVLPLKGRLADVFGTSWDRIEQRVQDAIHEAYDLPPMPVEVEGMVRDADQWLVYCEAIALKPDVDFERWGLRVPPPEVILLARVRQTEPNRTAVRDLFDGEVRRLVSLVDGRMPEDGEVPIAKPDTKRGQAAASLAEVMKDVPIPGERPPAPHVKPVGSEFVPNLSRAPRDGEMSEGSWRDAIQHSTITVPQRLLDDAEARARDKP